MLRHRPIIPLTAAALCACSSAPQLKPIEPSLSYNQETRVDHLRPVARGGRNTQPRWSSDGKHITFRHSGKHSRCDQIYTAKTDGTMLKRVSPGRGRASDPRFLPGDERILFSSTHDQATDCSVRSSMDGLAGWVIQPSQLYTAQVDGSDARVADSGAPHAYNAQPAVCHNGSVVFTSDRSGDLELYSAKLSKDGSLRDVRQLTRALGYDGGASFSRDCKRIVWAASRPTAGDEIEEYRAQLKTGFVQPGSIDLWVANADGTEAKPVTSLNVLSYQPVFAPGEKRVLFVSNVREPSSRQFELYDIALDGTGLTQLTYSRSVDAFAEISPGRSHIVFSSRRAAGGPEDLAIYIGDWDPPKKSRIATPTIVWAPHKKGPLPL